MIYHHVGIHFLRVYGGNGLNDRSPIRVRRKEQSIGANFVQDWIRNLEAGDVMDFSIGCRLGRCASVGLMMSFLTRESVKFGIFQCYGCADFSMRCYCGFTVTAV